MNKKDLPYQNQATKLSLAQFKNLDIKNPGSWPLAPQLALFLASAIVVFGIFWYLLLSDLSGQLAQVKNDETALRSSLQSKMQSAAGLDVYKKQKEQVGQYVLSLERQLPGKAEIEKLLSDINQAGVTRGLQFDLFKPEKETINDYYAEQPISIKVIGAYDAIGAFAADIANLSRIVTLNNITVTPKSDGYLIMEKTSA